MHVEFRVDLFVQSEFKAICFQWIRLVGFTHRSTSERMK